MFQLYYFLYLCFCLLSLSILYSIYLLIISSLSIYTCVYYFCLSIICLFSSFIIFSTYIYFYLLRLSIICLSFSSVIFSPYILINTTLLFLYLSLYFSFSLSLFSLNTHMNKTTRQHIPDTLNLSTYPLHHKTHKNNTHTRHYTLNTPPPPPPPHHTHPLHYETHMNNHNPTHSTPTITQHHHFLISTSHPLHHYKTPKSASTSSTA